MRSVMFVWAVAWLTGCQTRPFSRKTSRGDSLDFAQLIPRDSTDSTLRIPRVITAPTVVLFWLRAADTLEADDRADAFDDLRYSTEEVAPALQASGIDLLATNADTVYVRAGDGPRRTVLLSGLDYPYGYLLVDPGGPERILTGAYSDDELLDELRAYFDLPDDTTSVQPRVTT